MAGPEPPSEPAARAGGRPFDVAVVGAGAAGLYAALTAARAGARVALVSRSSLAESASYWAQGGIAAALGELDSPALHLEDTLAAGRGAGRPSAARALCEEAPAVVRDLETLGVRFDADRTGALALGLEGGHSARRVVHAGGAATGRRITRELSALAAQDANVEVIERTSAEALLVGAGRCGGVLTSGRTPVPARATILATGGAAALWARTTNPPGTNGAGLMLAHTAGAALADLELVQFHPTALALPGAPRDGFLLTEALRGEGALLLDEGGERFVDELAPRDEVALAITRRLARGGRVRLDMRMVDPARFPNVATALADAGLDPRTDLLPVAPAAHYAMGGVAADLHARSTVPGLLAVGECACTGLHGANRLASNSLAECFVFGRRAAEAALDEPAAAGVDLGRPAAPEGPRAPAPATREALWRHAGLVRDARDLRRLADDPHPLARLVAGAALARAESRGAHQRTDHPDTDPALDEAHFVVARDGAIATERWR